MVEVPTNTELRDLDLAGAKHFTGTADGVVFRMGKIVYIVDVRSNLRSEEGRSVGRIFRSRVAV